MRFKVIAPVLALAIALPADVADAAKSPKLARCDGRHRRPANPNGSILPTVDPQAGTATPAGSTPGGGVDVFPTPAPAPKPANPKRPSGDGVQPAPQVPPIGAIEPPRSYRSC